MHNLKFKNLNNIIICKFLCISFFALFIFLISAKAEAANLIFSPATGNFYEGNTFKVSVLVDTQDVSINSIEANISFPKEYLDVVSVSKVGSILSMWIQEPTISSTDGTIYFTGGLPTPGFIGSSGKIVDITFKAKKAGVAKISYSSGSVRANDGLGTNVLQSVGEGEYTINKTTEPVVPPTETKPTAALSPEISSLTHPDSEKWYSNKNPKFSWIFHDEFNAIRISYDENPEAVPTIFYSTTTSEKEFDNVRDGIYYLHLQVRDQNGWSKISNFKFQIDTERPLNFAITEIDKGNATKTQAEFTFNAVDELSGLDHFEINIDESAPEIINDVENQYYRTAVLGSGKHIIFVKAYDKAGNFVPSSALFYINSSAASTSIDKIISDITAPIKKIYDSIAPSAKDFLQKLNKEINSPIGSMLTKVISTIGLAIGAFISASAFASPTSLSELWLVIARLFGLLLGIIGLKRKTSSWGTIYDSITKGPLDFVYVSLIDLETGRKVVNTITDIDGRYGFLVLPGRYAIEITKAGYAFPSIKMKGKTSDEVHDELYFGGEIVITKEGEIITANIPMDPMIFDWSEFAKNKIYINSFIRNKHIILSISKLLFALGAITSVMAVIFTPVLYNFIIIGLYALTYLLSYMEFKKQKPGILSEKNTNIPLSYAIVKIYREGEETPIIKKVADKNGAYFTLVPNGRYYIVLDRKNDDESYTEVLHTTDIDVKNGIINFDIKV